MVRNRVTVRVRVRDRVTARVRVRNEFRFRVNVRVRGTVNCRVNEFKRMK